MMQTDTVTRVEIVENVGAAFASGHGADRSEVLAAAAATHARPQALDLLCYLPDRRFGIVNDLWEELGHVPIG